MEETKVVVLHRGGLAFYLVTPKGDGLYHVHLSRYDGKAADSPPSDVRLIQKADKWYADGEDDKLVQQLGKIIEQKLLKASSS